MNRAVALILLFALVGVAPGLHAQTRSTSSGQAYPTKPIRVIVPFPPGDSLDIMSRKIGGLSPIFPRNVPGSFSCPSARRAR